MGSFPFVCKNTHAYLYINVQLFSYLPPKERVLSSLSRHLALDLMSLKAVNYSVETTNIALRLLAAIGGKIFSPSTQSQKIRVGRKMYDREKEI